MKTLFKIMMVILAVLLLAGGAFWYYFFVGSSKAQEHITWGVDFSQFQAQSLKLNWQETYLAIINDLKAKNIKLLTQWDALEPQRGIYNFQDTDWQLDQANKNQVNIIYVVGLKSGRWPECHLPSWAKGLSKDAQQQALLSYIRETVTRYKGNHAIINWQVENEPLFNFGVCPSWYYQDSSLLEKEVALVRSLDPSRKIIVSDSGEQSTWFKAASIGDIVGVTMYREVWAHITDNLGFHVNSFLPPVTYWRKAQLINEVFHKEVICIELQAEPWASKPFDAVPLQEQYTTMNLDLFKKNITYAKATGLDRFYLWGVEWWYWLKTTQHNPDLWNEAKTLF